MPKGRKTLNIFGLRIDEPNEIPFVRTAIRAAINSTRLYLKPYPSHGAIVEFRLSDSQVPPSPTDDPGSVVRFFDLSEWRYWLGLQLKFVTSRGEAYFQSASLTILRSAFAAEEKKPMLRAEWEFRKGDEHHHSHAQPHWHVYAAAVQGGQRNEPALGMRRFHWAMATGWHQGETESHYRVPSAEGVASWIGQCVMYTREELKWVSTKM